MQAIPEGHTDTRAHTRTGADGRSHKLTQAHAQKPISQRTQPSHQQQLRLFSDERVYELDVLMTPADSRGPEPWFVCRHIKI